MEKIILFDGTSTEHWKKQNTDDPITWKVEDGCMTVTPFGGSIVSKEIFGDAHIHLEWREPDMPDKTGQFKGNSGVFIHGVYEVQVLDSYGIEPPTATDCGGFYNLYPPIVNACKPALEWQTYDIYVRAAIFEDGVCTKSAVATVFQNGVCIQNNVELIRGTMSNDPADRVPCGPLVLQDHGDPVSFRNIWIEKY